MTGEPLISVVVCTHNRARLLSGLLSSLEAQTLAKEQFEVVIVDNNSVDQTSQVAGEFAARHSNAIVVKERKLGLSNARNRGWQAARGTYVAYIDDDALAYQDWLSQILSFVRRLPEVPVFGGPYEAYSLGRIPEWYPPEAGSWNLGEVERPINVGQEWLNGTNMVFRRDVLAAVDGFNPALGMMGGRISYGEETRLLLDVAAEGMAVYYVPSIKVQHLVADYKTSLKWLLFSAYMSGRCSALTFNVKRSMPSHLIGVGSCLVKAAALLLRPSVFPFKRKLYYSLADLCAEWGAFLDCLSARAKRRTS